MLLVPGKFPSSITEFYVLGLNWHFAFPLTPRGLHNGSFTVVGYIRPSSTRIPDFPCEGSRQRKI